MAQRVNFQMLTDALRNCPDAPGTAECHGQICALLCGNAEAAMLETFLARWAQDAEENVSAEALSVLRCVVSDCRSALEDPDLSFGPLLPDDRVALAARVAALAEWTQGFLYGLVEAGPGWADASEAVRELVTDFAEIARLRGIGLMDEDEEEAYVELVEYIRMGILLMHEERAQVMQTVRERGS